MPLRAAVWLELPVQPLLLAGARVAQPAYRVGMQRLFTVFPAGIPGIALILLRLGVAASLWPLLPEGALSSGALRLFALSLISLSLLIGLATPLAATMAIVALMTALDPCRVNAAIVFNIANYELSALSLALIGPGAFSVDARLFGRRALMSS
jgi:hypothetical protein